MGFRENLLHLRQEQNMTQEQLAMLVGVTRQSVTKWEAGRATPDMDKLTKMCGLFDCTLDGLVQGDLTQRAPSPGRAFSAASSGEDVTGYDAYKRTFAWKVALGVALIVLGSAVGCLSETHPLALFAMFALIAVGLLLILPAAYASKAFKREHPFVIDFYTSEQRLRISVASGWELAAGIAVVLLSVGAVAFTEGAALVTGKDASEALAAALMLAGVAVGVGLIVHAALVGSRADVEGYNLDALSDLDREEVAALVGEDRADAAYAKLALQSKTSATCTVIMLLSTVIALALLFLAPGGTGSFGAFWVPWMLGGILCGAAAVILRARAK